MWSVPPPDLTAAKSAFPEVTNLAHPPALPDNLRSLLKTFPDAIVHVLPRDSPLFPRLKAEYIAPAASSEANNGCTVTETYLLAALARARITKSSYEVTQIRIANEISSRAHEVVMRMLGRAVKGLTVAEPGAGIARPLLPGEWLIEKEAEAEAVFVASCRREG